MPKSKLTTDEKLDLLIEKVDTKFDSIDARFDNIDNRFNEVDKQILNIKIDIHGIKIDIKELDQKIEERTKLIPDIWNHLDRMVSRMDTFEQEQTFMNNQLENLDGRASVLENN